ncbi:ERF family protein [Weissella tructae]
MEELLAIQTELVVPKNQYNDYGGYNYRNAEDIQEALKPLLKSHGCYLNVNSEVLVVGERYYREVTVTLTNSEGKSISAKSSAMEPTQKKGMDASQISGAAESYAKKYALGNLFAIDDTKDVDSVEESQNIQDNQQPPQVHRKNNQPSQNSQRNSGGFPQKKSANPLVGEFSGLVKKAMFNGRLSDDQVVYDRINQQTNLNIASVSDFATLNDFIQKSVVSLLQSWVSN